MDDQYYLISREIIFPQFPGSHRETFEDLRELSTSGIGAFGSNFNRNLVMPEGSYDDPEVSAFLDDYFRDPFFHATLFRLDSYRPEEWDMEFSRDYSEPKYKGSGGINPHWSAVRYQVITNSLDGIFKYPRGHYSYDSLKHTREIYGQPFNLSDTNDSDTQPVIILPKLLQCKKELVTLRLPVINPLVLKVDPRRDLRDLTSLIISMREGEPNIDDMYAQLISTEYTIPTFFEGPPRPPFREYPVTPGFWN